MGDSKITESKNHQKAFLLDDLIKNSLVFSAMNNWQNRKRNFINWSKLYISKSFKCNQMHWLISL